MATGKSTGNLPVRRECAVPGKHAWVLWNTQFEIDERYVPIKAIGKGAYGVVCSAKDTMSGHKVAIKKITNAFDNLTDARRTLREMKLLRHLKHENIIALRNILRPPARDNYSDVYLVSLGLPHALCLFSSGCWRFSEALLKLGVRASAPGLKVVEALDVVHLVNICLQADLGHGSQRCPSVSRVTDANHCEPAYARAQLCMWGSYASSQRLPQSHELCGELRPGALSGATPLTRGGLELEALWGSALVSCARAL